MNTFYNVPSILIVLHYIQTSHQQIVSGKKKTKKKARSIMGLGGSSTMPKF